MTTEAVELAESDALQLLRAGEIELEGLLAEASNATLRAWVTADGVTARCVYKPIRGERPLWDFPHGTLAGREVAAYLVSAATGWDLVPPTILRDGPLGPGACQLWVDEPVDAPALTGFAPRDGVPDGWLAVAAARGTDGRPMVLAHADDPRLARMAVLDIVINNADRKGGHLVTSQSGRVYGVDHGVSFHTSDKLRTVLWGWVGDALPAEAVETLKELRPGALPLAEHLTAEEVAAIGHRVDRLLAAGTYPDADHDWPPIPWPPL